MLGISATFLHAVFVYLRICICVLVYLTVQNIIFDVLGPLAFQKYSIRRVCEVFPVGPYTESCNADLEVKSLQWRKKDLLTKMRP